MRRLLILILISMIILILTTNIFAAVHIPIDNKTKETGETKKRSP